jgi:hypothetical protein
MLNLGCTDRYAVIMARKMRGYLQCKVIIVAACNRRGCAGSFIYLPSEAWSLLDGRQGCVARTEDYRDSKICPALQKSTYHA